MLGAIIGDTIDTRYMLDRFLEAQERDYECALQEIKDGQKQSHWIWYIFPQIKGLGYSSMSEYYGIGSREEAEAYLANDILNAHLREITQSLLSHSGSRTAWEILGTIDAIKVRSCMTLFDHICPNDIFAEVLDAFYEGQRCEKTIQFFSADFCKNRGLISTGFPSLDNILGGLHPGDFVFIGSRPGMGKTSMAVNLAINILDNMDFPVLFVSLRNPAHILRSYFRSIRTRMPIIQILRDDFLHRKNDLIKEVERQLFHEQIYIDDSPYLTYEDFQEKCFFLVRKYGVKCIILDDIEALSPLCMFTEEHEEDEQFVSRSMKELSQELGVPIIVSGCLGNSANVRFLFDRQSPTLSDLCYQSIVNDADVIFFLHRPEYYYQHQFIHENKFPGKAEIVVKKNNHGNIGSCWLRFDDKTCKIAEL